MLFLPSLVTDGGSELQAGPVGERTASGANYNSQTRLLEDLAVVVVGVSHGPARQMPLGILIFT